MRTENTTTTAAIEIPASIYRLAKQMHQDPATLAARILEAGIEAIDDDFAAYSRTNETPIAFFGIGLEQTPVHRFTLSGIIESMSDDERDGFQREADEAGQSLQKTVFDCAAANLDRENLQWS